MLRIHAEAPRPFPQFVRFPEWVLVWERVWLPTKLRLLRSSPDKMTTEMTETLFLRAGIVTRGKGVSLCLKGIAPGRIQSSSLGLDELA